MTKQLRGSFILLLTAAIWGAAFSAQSHSLDYVGPFTLQTIRFFLAGLVLLPLIAFCDHKGLSDQRPVTRGQKKHQLRAGFFCGLVLFAASSFQQVGMAYTSVGKSGFITALYITIVPLLGLFMKRRVRPRIWLCAALGVVGLYVLCVKGAVQLNIGDGLTLVCAVFFALHICLIDFFSPDTDPIRLSCTQFFVCCALSAIPMVLTEQPNWRSIADCWWPIAYAGIFSGGVAYTLQILGQRTVPPTLASLLMSMESVFAALFGWLLLGQRLSLQELLGCAIVFLSIILAQLPEKTEKKQK